MQYNTPEFKNSSLATDEFAEHVGQTITVIPINGRPITGRFVSMSDRYITLEHRDGRHTKIRRQDVSILSQVRAPEAV